MLETLGNTLSKLFDQNSLVSLFGKTLLALGLLLFFLVIARFLRRLVNRVTGRTSRNANLPILLSNLVYVVILAIGALSILSVYTNQSLSTLLTLLGLLSLAISLSVQDVLKNFVAGIYLLLEQPFSIGDRIKVKEFEGKVENIEIRTTTIHTDDGVKVYIPNNLVFSEIVTNRTAYHQRLSTVRFSLSAQESDYTTISKKILAIVTALEPARVSPDPAPHILVESVSQERITARLNFWSPINAPLSTSSDLMLNLSKDLPQLTLSELDTALPEAGK